MGMTFILYNGFLVSRYIPEQLEAKADGTRLCSLTSLCILYKSNKTQVDNSLDNFKVKNRILQKYVDNFPVSDKGICTERQKNVAFLKVHKAGSTTVMNIFLRFAQFYDLNVVYPRPENYLGFDTTINVDNILPPPKGQTYNILCNHVVYNKTVFYKFLPADTVFIAIVRDPITQIISAAQFFDLFIDLREKIGHMTGQQLMTTFLKNPDICTEEEQKFVKTRMCRDFGIRHEDIESKDKLIEHLLILSKDFKLVMVMEMFDESLILMKRYLCWDLKDILYIPLNRLPKHRNERVEIKGKDLENLKSYNWPDFILYDFFKALFLKRIKTEQNDFHDEVKTFKQILKEIQTYCEVENKAKNEYLIGKTQWNEEFIFTKSDCIFATKHEWTLLDELKTKYKMRHRLK